MYRPILLPETRDFADLLEYHHEWLPEMSGRNGAPATPGVAPARLQDNEIGPYCNIDLSQLGSYRSRGIVVTAKPAVLEAVAPRIVTPDDRLSFRIIGHAHSGRALVILEHGYISGSHWLAEIDPATIPAYPFETRDAAVAQLCQEIRETTGWVPWRRDLEGGAAQYGYTATDKPGEGFQRLPAPVIVAHVAADGTVTRES